MESKIRVLSDDVVNKIAAGEVIENPASVVKELVENSLDANATEITIEVLSGGRELIRVTDNGCGMSKDDALLSIERHSTSKIQQIDDLNSLMTMGFRGEAIASIASVSKFTLITSPGSEEEGTILIVNGGKGIKCDSCPRTRGTTIEVKSLFYNVPVRKKFQKSPASDATEVFKMVNKLAMGNPHVKFQLFRDKKPALDTGVYSECSEIEGLKKRIVDCLGEEFAQGLIPVNSRGEHLRLYGYIGTPSNHRPNRMGQHLFINYRPIQSKIISNAVREGYGTTIPMQRHPVFILHLEVSSLYVDVNVHPQKKEARFREQERLSTMIAEAVSRGLTYKEQPLKQKSPLLEVSPSFEQPFRHPEPYSFVAPPVQLIAESPEKYEEELLLELPPSDLSVQPRVLETIPGYILIDPDSASMLEGVGEKEGLILMDQQRAHHRILFERLLSGINSSGDAVQQLIVPHTLELNKEDAESLRDRLKVLYEIGFAVREFGQQTFLVETIPTGFEESRLGEAIERIVQEVREFPVSGEQLKGREKHLVNLSFYGIVEKKQRLSLMEAIQFLGDLWECSQCWYCPKGNPIFSCIEQSEIEKAFA